MSRHYMDPISVRVEASQRLAGRPTVEPTAASGPDGPAIPVQFFWRRRRYDVLVVHLHWLEVGPWWAQLDPGREGQGQRSAQSDGSAQPVDTTQSDRTALSVAPPPVAAVTEQTYRLWRLTARTGNTDNTGLYDLCSSTSDQRWWLVRMCD